jgi:membrane associated rhomboid family serine protease
VHGDFAHLVANSVPLAAVGSAMLFLYPHSALRVLPAVYLGPGLIVWLFGRDSVHLGASGLVYGLVSYVFMAGLLRRDRRAIAASLLVILVYGSLAWGVLPIDPRVSWETHLAAASIGVLMALALRRFDVPPRKRYVWEDEIEAAEDDPAGWREIDEGGPR